MNVSTEPSRLRPTVRRTQKQAVRTLWLAAIVCSTSVGADESDVGCESDDALRQSQALTLINSARASARFCGSEAYSAAAPVQWNDTLLLAARRHSKAMSAGDFFDHTGKDGSDMAARTSDAGYNWMTVGENIAAGQRTLRDVVDGWLASPPHCSNLMSAEFTEIAVDCSANPTSKFGTYWTNVLASPLR